MGTKNLEFKRNKYLKNLNKIFPKAKKVNTAIANIKYPGLTKRKFCWMANETKKGWKLGLCVGSKTSYMRFLFHSEKEVKKVFDKSNIVFIHLKNKQ